VLVAAQAHRGAVGKVAPMDPIRTLIISIPESAEGKKRAEKRGDLQQHEEYFTGYTEVPEFVSDKFAGRHKGETRRSSLGCLYSHMMVWEKIACDGIGSIVLEDDMIKCRTVDYSLLKSRYNLVLLGGVVRTAGAWKREQSEYVQTNMYFQRVDNFIIGLNDLGKNKFTGSCAYYMPVEVAKALVAHVKNVAHFRVADVFMKSSVDNIQVLWPNSFMEMPASRSQCNSPARDLQADLFLSLHFQKHAGEKFTTLLAKFPRLPTADIRLLLVDVYVIYI